MEGRFTLTRAEMTPESVDVRDFDQLDDREKTCLWRLASGESVAAGEWGTARRLSQYGVIKYTDFVEVSKTNAKP